jgi:hypothetical protein
MTEFETKALQLLKSIDESLKIVRDFAIQEIARDKAKMAQMNKVMASLRPDTPKK